MNKNGFRNGSYRFLVLSMISLGLWLAFQLPAGYSAQSLPASSGTTANAQGFVCYAKHGATRVMPAPASDVSFAKNVSLDLEVHGDGVAMAQDRLSIVAKHVAQAMILWRSACTHCFAGNITVIIINGGRYVDSALAEFLRANDLNNIVDQPPRTPTSEEIEIWKRTPAHFGPRPSTDAPAPSPPSTPAAPQSGSYPYSIFLSMLSQHQTPGSILAEYELVTEDDPAFKKLCAADEHKLPQTLKDVRSSFQCSATQRTFASDQARLRIYALDRFTSCGKNPNIIGCSADDLVVEFNARDYQFVDHDSGDVVFGSTGPKVDLLHVILHETGHWMGLPHLSIPGNIMAHSLQESRCIDDSDISALDSVVLDEQGRMKGQGAFFYREPTR